MKRPKRNPDSLILASVPRQYWIRADAVASMIDFPPTLVRRRMAKLVELGKLDRQPCLDYSGFEYRLRR